MANRKIDNATTARWMFMADNWLAALPKALTRKAVTTGVEAWSVASQSGILTEAYKDRTITDAHIATALEEIFPNAIFLDKKVY